MSFDLDLFVIGAGSGGVRAARIAGGYGARAMVAEEFRIGGTCVIRGCVPKKLMVYASRFADDFCDAAGFGWRVGETSFDWPSLVAAKEKEISRLSAIYRVNLEAAGVQVVEERAEIRERASGQRQAHSHRHGRRASAHAEHSRARTRHLIQRNLRSQILPQPAPGRRRRLHSGRVRFAVRPPRRDSHSGDARRQYPPRFR